MTKLPAVSESQEQDGPMVALAQEEHRRIKQLLSNLEAADKPQSSLAILENLMGVLPGHFRTEEGEHGLFAQMTALKPSIALKLKQLSAQHRDIEGSVRRLIELCREIMSARNVYDEALQETLDLIHTHEKEEMHAVMETYWRDGDLS